MREKKECLRVLVYAILVLGGATLLGIGMDTSRAALAAPGMAAISLGVFGIVGLACSKALR